MCAGYYNNNMTPLKRLTLIFTLVPKIICSWDIAESIIGTFYCTSCYLVLICYEVWEILLTCFFYNPFVCSKLLGVRFHARSRKSLEVRFHSWKVEWQLESLELQWSEFSALSHIERIFSPEIEERVWCISPSGEHIYFNRLKHPLLRTQSPLRNTLIFRERYSTKYIFYYILSYKISWAKHHSLSGNSLTISPG